MKSIIHVNQHHIRDNTKGSNKPVFTVKQGKKNSYATSVDIQGPSKLVYSPDKPLSWGARVWIETNSQIVLEGEVSYKELVQ